MRVLGYVRVSTIGQQDGGGLAAQREAIAAECERRGWQLIETVEDIGSAKNLKRVGIQEALDALSRGRADALIVSKVDRLSRSMLDLAAIMATAQRESWALVALDCIDTSTAGGEAMGHVLGAFAQLERRMIGQRTKEGIAAKKAAGTLRGPLGRPPEIPAAVINRIKRESAKGKTPGAIARLLNDAKVPTARGGREWYASTVRTVLKRLDQP